MLSALGYQQQNVYANVRVSCQDSTLPEIPFSVMTCLFCCWSIV